MSEAMKQRFRDEILSEFEGVDEKREALMADHKIFKTLDEMICEKHDDAKFMEISSKYNDVKLAACDLCLDDRTNTIHWDDKLKMEIPDMTRYMNKLVDCILADDKLRIFQVDVFAEHFKGTSAYHCKLSAMQSLMYRNLKLDITGCGWVLGAPEKDSELTGADSRGIVPTFNFVDNYTCGVCGMKLGEYDPRPKIHY